MSSSHREKISRLKDHRHRFSSSRLHRTKLIGRWVNQNQFFDEENRLATAVAFDYWPRETRCLSCGQGCAENRDVLSVLRIRRVTSVRSVHHSDTIILLHVEFFSEERLAVGLTSQLFHHKNDDVLKKNKSNPLPSCRRDFFSYVCASKVVRGNKHFFSLAASSVSPLKK